MLENLDDRKLAYFIGFMSGDGSYEGGVGRTPRMSIGTTDMEVVDWISKNIEYFPPDKEVWGNNPTRGIYATKPSYRKCFSTKYSNIFNKYGILCKKEDRNIFNISKKSFKYYLLGLIDADGFFTFSQRKDRDRLVGKFGIANPSLHILSKVQTFLLEELNIPSSVTPKGSEKCYALQFSRLSDVMKFGDYLWSDKEAIVITRKYNTYLDFRKQYLERLNTGSMLPSEFTCTDTYRSLVGSVSKYVFISPEGKEYYSTYLLPDELKGNPRHIRDLAIHNRQGWSSREKTLSEVTEYKAFIKRETIKLFNIWKSKQ